MDAKYKNQGAWKIFGMSIITLGIYPVYKLAQLQRAIVELAEKKTA